MNNNVRVKVRVENGKSAKIDYLGESWRLIHDSVIDIPIGLYREQKRFFNLVSEEPTIKKEQVVNIVEVSSIDELPDVQFIEETIELPEEIDFPVKFSTEIAEEPENFDKLSFKELKDLAKEKGLNIFGKSKAAIIEFLKENN